MTLPLAVKYRPQTFRDVVGQDDVVLALKAMLQKNYVPGVLLFHGPAGSGKTTLARIFAKALNCEARGRDCEPCCECASCLAVQTNTAVDVLEIDAASQTGVDNVRELISWSYQRGAFAAARPDHGRGACALGGVLRGAAEDH